jgi:hypothetical protein
MEERIKTVLEKFPFLSYGRMLDVDYLGIIQNSDSQLLSIYVLDSIPDEGLRAQFIACGEEWWWESNRMVPINIYLKDRFRPFRPYLKHFSRKDFDLVAGHAVSLQETIARRVRKRQVTLVQKPT